MHTAHTSNLTHTQDISLPLKLHGCHRKKYNSTDALLFYKLQKSTVRGLVIEMSGDLGRLTCHSLWLLTCPSSCYFPISLVEIVKLNSLFEKWNRPVQALSSMCLQKDPLYHNGSALWQRTGQARFPNGTLFWQQCSIYTKSKALFNLHFSRVALNSIRPWALSLCTMQSLSLLLNATSANWNRLELANYCLR